MNHPGELSNGATEPSGAGDRRRDGEKPETRPVRTVLFDFGGVLATEGFREGLKELARRHGCDPQTVYREGVEAVYASGYVVGRATEADFWGLLCRRTGLPAYRPEFTRTILESFRLRPLMLRAVDRLRHSGRQVAILSDQTDWLDRLEARDGFASRFDRVFNSYHLGRSKRDPQLFGEVVAWLGERPEATLFIDDDPGNVERSLCAGLQGLRWVDESQVLAQLERLL